MIITLLVLIVIAILAPELAFALIKLAGILALIGAAGLFIAAIA